MKRKAWAVRYGDDTYYQRGKAWRAAGVAFHRAALLTTKSIATGIANRLNAPARCNPVGAVVVELDVEVAVARTAD